MIAITLRKVPFVNATVGLVAIPFIYLMFIVWVMPLPAYVSGFVICLIGTDSVLGFSSCIRPKLGSMFCIVGILVFSMSLL